MKLLERLIKKSQKEKTYKPGQLHKWGICHKANLGYLCQGRPGECGNKEKEE